MVKFVDWFAGIGGFRHGLEKANTRAYEKQNKEQGWEDTHILSCQGDSRFSERANGQPAGFRCVGACEIDRWCRQVYKRNFGQEPEWGDSRAVDPAGLPDFDLFCAGFSCKGLSMAGRRLGFDHLETRTFYEIPRICGAKKPPYLLIENVEGFLFHDRGRSFEIALQALDEVGYDLQWEVLNSRHFGVPQSRPRVFIVGHLRGVPRPQVFPLGEDDQEASGVTGARQSDAVYAIDSNYGKGCYTPGKSNTRTMIIDALNARETDIPTALRRNMGNSGPLVANAVDHTGFLLRPHRKAEESMSNRLLRQLTPLECERLQGFPDGYTEGVSDTQRYRMLGNAVTITVVEAIGIRLLEEISGHRQP